MTIFRQYTFWMHAWRHHGILKDKTKGIFFIGNIIKAVIFAGDLGTRLSEKTTIKPKPMVETGGKPILWQFSPQHAVLADDSTVDQASAKAAQARFVF